MIKVQRRNHFFQENCGLRSRDEMPRLKKEVGQSSPGPVAVPPVPEKPAPVRQTRSKDMPVLMKEESSSDDDSSYDDEDEDEEDEDDGDSFKESLSESSSEGKLFSPTLQKMLLEPPSSIDFNHNTGAHIPSNRLGTCGKGKVSQDFSEANSSKALNRSHGRKLKDSENIDTESKRDWRIPKLTIRLRRESSSENSCGGTDSPSSRGSGSVVYEILQNKEPEISSWSSPTQRIPRMSQKRQKPNSLSEDFTSSQEKCPSGEKCRSFPLSPEVGRKQIRRMRLKFGEDSIDITIPPCSKAAP